MYVDKNLEFSDAQAETTVATHASTNDVDTQVAGDSDMFMVISIHDAFTSGGSATVNFQLSTSAASNHSSPVVLWQSGVLAFNNALLGAGKSFIFRIPKGALRYLRVNQIVAGAALTAGSFDAFITDNVDSYIGQ